MPILYTNDVNVEKLLTQDAVNYVPNFPTVTPGGTLTLDANSLCVQMITGVGSPYTVKLPNATTIAASQFYKIFNFLSTNVTVVDADNGPICSISRNTILFIWLRTAGSLSGSWVYVLYIMNSVSGAGGYLQFSRGGGVSQNAYLYSGQTLTSATGVPTNGYGIITKLAVANSSVIAAGKNANFRLQRQTGVATFVDIAGTDVTIPENSWFGTVENLNVQIGPNWAISAYRTSDLGGGVNNVILTCFTVAT